MMKKIIYILLVSFLSLVSTSVNAQTDANIFGDVQCKGKHVPFATISIKGTTIGTATDATGHYSLVNLDEGEYIILASAIGYHSTSQPVTVKKNKVTEVNFILHKDMIGVEEVVVSSDRNATNRKEATVMINTINSQLFETTQSTTLVEGLDFTPGLRTECNCSNCGFTQVRMNGLEGPYSQILINSRPVFSGLAGVYGLELFPANMVERVEIVRGGGSALFGGNAIAGTINVITKEPTVNGFQIGSKVSLAGIGDDDIDEPSIDRTLNLNGTIISDNQKSGLSFYGMLRDRDPYDDNNDGFSEEVLMKNQTLGFSTYYKPTKQSKINLDLYSIHEFRRGGNKFDFLPHETDITEQLDHKIAGANLSYDYYTANYNTITVFTSGQKVDRESYYGSLNDKEGYGTTDDVTAVTGFQYTLNFPFLKSKLMLGTDHKYSGLVDVKLGVEGRPNTTVSNQRVNVLGSFAQYELKYGILKTGYGLRFDNYSIEDLGEDHGKVTGNVFAPRANALLDFTDDLQLRMSYARGYRAPQLYDEDLHIETSGARRVTHQNSDDLQQENSNSYNLSLKYSSVLGHTSHVQLELVAEGFYTQLLNPFSSTASVPDAEGNVVYTRINAEDGAMVYGSNYEVNVGFENSLMFQTGFTVQKSVYETEQQWGENSENTSKSFMRSPDDYGYVTISYEPVSNFQTSLTGTYTGKMLVPHFGLSEDTEVQAEIDAINAGHVIVGEKLETSGRFLNMGAQVSYKIEVKNQYKIQLSMGMQNILNQSQHDHDSGVYRDAAYIYGPHKARMLSFGIKIGNNL